MQWAVCYLQVGNKFHNIMNVAIDNPGEFYYNLIPKPVCYCQYAATACVPSSKLLLCVYAWACNNNTYTQWSLFLTASLAMQELGDSFPTYGIVVEVAVTGEKKTITTRSPIQVQIYSYVGCLKLSMMYVCTLWSLQRVSYVHTYISVVSQLNELLQYVVGLSPFKGVIFRHPALYVYHAYFPTFVSNITRNKNIYNVRGVGMANESTKTTQTSVRMTQHNKRTRLHDLSCTPTYQSTRALVMPTLFVYCVESSAHLFVWFLLIH